MRDKVEAISASPEKVEKKPVITASPTLKNTAPVQQTTTVGQSIVPRGGGDPQDTSNLSDDGRQVATQDAQQTLPADFNKMTPEQQYNYLHDLSVAMAGGDESVWRTGEKDRQVESTLYRKSSSSDVCLSLWAREGKFRSSATTTVRTRMDGQLRSQMRELRIRTCPEQRLSDQFCFPQEDAWLEKEPV